MIDKEFVQSIMPNATCCVINNEENKSDDSYNLCTGQVFVIYDIDKHNRSYIIGQSNSSEEDAWSQVADSFRQKMLSQLEKS